jgi:hypothetical protein
VFIASAVVVLSAGVAQAQPRGECSTPRPLGIGVSAGRSLTPYFDFSPGVFDTGGLGSISLEGGVHLGARVDAPIAGPWRARLEVSGANWRVDRQVFGAGSDLVAIETMGHVEARQILASVGRQVGYSPACGYVLVGGGLFSLDVEGTRVRRPGLALTAGIEMPVTDRGALQFEAQVHVIRTDSRPPIASSDALAASISFGWLHRF